MCDLCTFPSFVLDRVLLCNPGWTGLALLTNQAGLDLVMILLPLPLQSWASWSPHLASHLPFLLNCTFFLFLLLLLTAAHFMPRVHSLPYSFLFGPLSHAHQKWRNMRTAIGSYIHEKVSWVRGGPVVCKTLALAPGKTSLEPSIRVCM